MKIIDKLLTINKYSRPGIKLKGVKAIVIHWVANPMASALANIAYFENRKHGNSGYGSAHYFVNLDGQVYRCIPDNEVSYNCGSKKYTRYKMKKFGNNNPNFYTIAIELCHIDWKGTFPPIVLNSAIELCSELCQKYSLDPLEDITTHQAIVGWKDCPRWFVNNPEDFIKFKHKIKCGI